MATKGKKQENTIFSWGGEGNQYGASMRRGEKGESKPGISSKRKVPTTCGDVITAEMGVRVEGGRRLRCSDCACAAGALPVSVDF